ncbi:(Fe-S)-binding protein [Geobacter grbiciae]|uniref:(Fe-S)-binding protein n=1 Tax=Geobacter grbiciae TaxID=155042 RepID=UPI001C038A38|nr:(Fe-S)-binding protein [Geobacter grbiciae]MBT1076251.1 (Fe-S)-binding protein [Geobacter grbiciae]
MTIFTPLFLIAIGVFIWQCGKKLSLIRLGRPENRFDNPSLRLWDMLLYAFGQKRVVARPFGINHFVIFWAFVVLLMANGAFILEGLIPGFRLANVLPTALYHPLVFAFDIVSLFALAAIVLSFARRLIFKPAYLDSAYVSARSFEAFLILSFIALLMIASFGLNGVKIVGGLEPASFMPVSAVAANMLAESGASLPALGSFFWWLHATVLLAFICFLPMSKHMHILTAIPNCFFQNLGSTSTQPREEFAVGNRYGVEKVTDLTWKDLFDSFSCTECGRCQDACPANATGKSLNPRQVVHSLKANLLANEQALKAGEPPRVPLIGAEGEGTNTEETIWACTTCGACLQACPVMIEHPSKLVGMRRHLVEMKTTFPEELLNLFENMEQRSNPWGIAPSERAKWAAQMDVKPFEAGKTEYLFYVGCAGSFDSRSKQVTVNVATILDAAGISWGILGKDEKCCGDSLRRLGNEYVFDRMARENVEIFRERGVTKVIVQCPHCFTTLKNDYRQYGLELEVIHHSELIQQLLDAGRLKLNRQVSELGKIILHDSCYLGRHNDVYEAPRQVVAKVAGAVPAEFDRAREESFCCGAGGGRMWMEEQTGTRINLNRVTEALSKNPDTICVACPYCMTMFEDGLKDKQAGQTKVRDIAEVVAEAMRPAQ